jgi:FlaG/FlaF family flagellin (archaellin)
MQKLARNRKGLSQVITTLIILVVAVLLTGVVTYYSTNVTMVRTTQEEVRIRKPHIWVEEGGNAYAAILIQNTGGRDILVDKLTIRGVEAPWGDATVIVQYYKVLTGDDVGADFAVMKNVSDSYYFGQIGSVPINASYWTNTTGDMPLKSSNSLLIFVKNPPNIALYDVGTTISMAVYTSNAQWIVETVVESAEVVDFP